MKHVSVSSPNVRGAKSSHDLCWLADLAAKVLHIKDISQIEPLPKDFTGSMMYLLYSELDDRAYDVIIARYRDAKTLDEIGQKYGLTRERVRQIEVSALEDLKNSAHMPLIFMGMDAHIAKEGEDSKKQAVHNAMKSSIDFFRDRLKEFERTLEQDMEQTGEINGDPVRFYSICSIGLSQRAVNGLFRSQITTVGELLDYMQANSLYNLRSVGRNTVSEISEKISSMGYVIPASAMIPQY